MVQVRGDRIDDAPVQIQPEVIAGREVRQPMLADPDHAPVDLVDHRVDHGMRVLQASEVRGRLEPALEPAVLGPAMGPAEPIGRTARLGSGSHAATIGPGGSVLYQCELSPKDGSAITR